MNRILKRQIDIIFRDITSLGGLSFFILVLLLALAFQKMNLLMKLLAGFFITFAVVILVRTLYFKDRPKKREFSNYFERIEASSFPSLHTARVVFTAAVFVRFFDNFSITIFMVTIAAIISYSRIYLKKHDLLDVSFGILLGLITFWIVGLV